MSTFDRTSRLRTHLRTADGFYDQGLAVSQGIINKSFARLYERYPEMRGFSYENVLAKMEGVMLPSRLIIPEANLNLGKIIHVLRFDTGSLTVPSSPTPIKLDKFEIGVVCDLDLQFIKERPDETEREKRQREFIEREFRVPGDYRLERLYSKFTSANWNHFDIFNSKYFDENGEEMTYAQWLEKDQLAPVLFGTMLGMYGNDMEAEGLSTLGLSITLPGLPPELIPTFIPTDMIHQIYPYRDEQGQSEYGDTPMGDRNCLLYLEVVKREDGSDGRLPDAKQVGYSGNFCYPPASLEPGVDGTFLLGGELFMGRYLLRQFQALNEASSMYAHRNTFAGTGGWAFPMSIGSDPRYANHLNEAYRFHKSQDGRSWVYEKNSDNSTPVASNGTNSWWSSDHWSKARTVVSWQPGTDLYVKVEGEYEYYRGITFANNQQMTNPGTYSKEMYTGKWNLGVRMVVEEGVLMLRLESTEDLDFLVTGEVEVTPDLGEYANNKYVLRDDIKGKILPRLSVLRNNLREGFQGDHQFVFPGTGQLTFNHVTFNNGGDIITGVVWKEVDGPVIVRPPNLTNVNNLEAYRSAEPPIVFGRIHRLPEDDERRDEP